MLLHCVAGQRVWAVHRLAEDRQLQLFSGSWGLRVYGGGSSGKSLSRSRGGQPGMAAARTGSRESPQPSGLGSEPLEQ